MCTTVLVGALVVGYVLLGMARVLVLGMLGGVVTWACWRAWALYTAHRDRVFRVSELWVYPVKSCGGVSVAEARLLRGGLEWDREFAVVTADGEVLSQKTHPALASIQPTLHTIEAGALSAITLSAGALSVRVDLTSPEGAEACTTMWVGNSAPLAALRLPAATAMLSQHMGFACHLCRLQARRSLRTTRLASVADDPADCCRYQDGAPLTLLSEASVTALNKRAVSASFEPCREEANIKWQSLIGNH